MLRRFKNAAYLLLVLSTSACSSVHVQGDPSFRFQSGDRYDWLSSTQSSAASEDGSVPIEDFKRAIDAQLGKRGLLEVGREDAKLLLEVNLRVESSVVSNDSNFDLYPSEIREDGVISLVVKNASDRSIAWGAETRVRLRYAAHSAGDLIGTRWISNGTRRDWHIAEVLDRLLAKR